MEELSNRKRFKLVGEFIKKRREFLGLSQRALGLLFPSPVTTQFISNVERGVTPLPPAHIPVLAKALDIPGTELMALLEKEYVLKLNGRFSESDSHEPGKEHEHGLDPFPTLMILNADYDFMKNLYGAYQGADAKTRQAFAMVCESILKLSKSTVSSS